MIPQSHFYEYRFENQNWKRHMHPSGHYNTIYNSQDVEASNMSINRWMDKEVICVHREYDSAMKKMK